MEEGSSLTSQVLSFIFNSLCSLALPVGLSFYFAPDKSWQYFEDTVQGKIDEVRAIRFEHIYETVLDVLKEIPPMLETEKQVFLLFCDAAPPAFAASFEHFISLDYRILIALVTILLITGYFFPWKACKEWIMKILWGSLCVVAGFLPIDSGLEVLEDKDAGPYKMIVMFCSVIVALVTNYIAAVTSWWILTKSLSRLWRYVKGSKKDKKGDVKKGGSGKKDKKETKDKKGNQKEEKVSKKEEVDDNEKEQDEKERVKEEEEEKERERREREEAERREREEEEQREEERIQEQEKAQQLEEEQSKETPTEE